MAPMNHPPGWGSWSLDPIAIIALLAASYVYARMYRRAASRSAAVGAGHWAPYAAGIAVLAIALLSPLDAIGDGWLLSAHMLQHVLLSDVAPALIVLGLRSPVLPLGLARPALRAVAPGGRWGVALGVLTSPWVAIPLWATATWVWAIPAMFDFAAQHPFVHALEHATLFYTGLALWWLIVDPLPRARLRPNGQRLALLGFTRLASAAICVPLTWMTSVQYPLYASAPRGFGVSAIADQQLAGAGMCFIEFLVFGIAFAAVFISMLGREDSREAVAERAAAAR
jgi:cytochrome c oxidase assembly factor CtaG